MPGNPPRSRDRNAAFAQVQELIQTLMMPPSPPDSCSRRDGGGSVASSPARSPFLGRMSSLSPTPSPSLSGPGGRRASTDSSPVTPEPAHCTAVSPNGNTLLRRSEDPQRGPFHGGSDGASAASGKVPGGLPGNGLPVTPVFRASISDPSPMRPLEGRAPLLQVSPVRSALLAWLVRLAAETTIEALRLSQSPKDNGLGSGVGGCLNGGASATATAAPPYGDSGVGSDVAVSPYANGVAGEQEARVAGAGAGAAGRCDWALVEVLLRMLSAVSKAVVRGDACYAGGGCQYGGWEPGGIGREALERDSLEGGPGTASPLQRSLEGPGGDGRGSEAALEALVDALPALPVGLRQLQRSAVVLIGGLGPWLAKRARSTESALKSLLNCLALAEEGAGQEPHREASMREKGEEHVRGERGRVGSGSRGCICYGCGKGTRSRPLHRCVPRWCNGPKPLLCPRRGVYFEGARAGA